MCCCCRLQCATSTYGVGRETRQQLGLLLLVAVLAQHRVDQRILHVANLRVSQSSSNAEFVHASVSNEGDRGLTHTQVSLAATYDADGRIDLGELLDHEARRRERHACTTELGRSLDTHELLVHHTHTMHIIRSALDL